MTNVPCSCCGQLTLSARSRFEICPACRREDDGQDDDGALPHVDAGPDSDATAEEFEGWWQAPFEPPVR